MKEVSEFVLSLILYHAKQLRQLQAAHDQRTWRKSWLVLPELANSTVLILGTGNIGQAIAARIKPFGARVWGGRRRPEPLTNFDKTATPNNQADLVKSYTSQGIVNCWVINVPDIDSNCPPKNRRKLRQHKAGK
ncbi:NAD(P)-dependent oxidoreductase [Nostoc sp.]|uniref:NAD(P)-dependent oxidoreductase n=1 Tax=Nostoc sp. TaxID=1180 RepID=UPI003FA52ABE